MLHHHDGYAGRFGISSPLWDLLFGTYAGLDKRRPIRKARPAAQADVSDATPAE
jgi:sterol desaturase/sphingolipid hydroxylase (fatty acid hydroxylase superfamily)